MKIGIVNNSKINETIEEFDNDFRMIKEAGFSYIDLQNFLSIDNIVYSLNDSDFNKYMVSIKETAMKYDLIINQLHSYWDYPPLLDEHIEKIDEQLTYYYKSIDGASILETKYLVIHPRFPYMFDEKVNENKKDEVYKINVDFLKKLEVYGRKKNVIICLENMPMNLDFSKLDSVIKIVKDISSDYVKLCLDLGHCYLFSNDIYEDILKCKDVLKCVHIHDNKKDHDSHLFPMDGKIDFGLVRKALKEIGYDGVFSIETLPNKKLSEKTYYYGLKYLYSITDDIMNGNFYDK